MVIKISTLHYSVHIFHSKACLHGGKCFAAPVFFAQPHRRYHGRHGLHGSRIRPTIPSIYSIKDMQLEFELCEYQSTITLTHKRNKSINTLSLMELKYVNSR